MAAEIIGMPKGSVGQMLYMSKIYLDTDDLLAWTVIIVVLSVIFEKLVVLALKAALKNSVDNMNIASAIFALILFVH